MYIALSATMGALAVVLGAFGAHGLESVLTEDMIDTYEIGVRYHFYHAGAALVLAIAGQRLLALRSGKAAFAMFNIGIVIFSGSLYLLAVSGIRWLGAITPIGGVAFIAGWVLLAYAGWATRSDPTRP